jgi:glutamyl-tRNA reductase
LFISGDDKTVTLCFWVLNKIPNVLEDLVILHRPAKSNEQIPVALNGLDWQTCLRRISLLHKSESAALLPQLPESSEVFEGKDAYNFLLEVVCGLRSPLVGETAVMGQFREFCATTRYPSSEWGWYLRRLTSDLLVDAKRVRSRHLEGLGSQSYGGMVRQHLRNVPSVFVLGAGQLGQEILPWLIGKTDVTVFYRNAMRAETLIENYPEVKLAQFKIERHEESRPTALVIAAPVTAREINSWIRPQQIPFVKALDLRGEAENDPFLASFPVVRLSEMFAALKRERPRVAARLAAARAEIDQAAQRLVGQAQFRPFGWEDLCA